MSDLDKLRVLVAAAPKPPCAAVFAEGRLWGSDGRLAVHATATLAAK